MAKLRPSGVDLHFKYTCDCGFDHWLTRQEARTEGFKIVCTCGKTYEVDPILKIDVACSYATITSDPLRTPQSALNVNDAIKTLTSAGYSREVATQYVNSVNLDQIKTTQDLIAAALAKVPINERTETV